MLANIQRTISGEQLPTVKEALRGCNSPLYVKLVFDQISLWKSYTTDIVIAKSIDDCVSKLFERVESSHGKILVSHALAYITASKNGLSEAELEDLISLDETVRKFGTCKSRSTTNSQKNLIYIEGVERYIPVSLAAYQKNTPVALDSYSKRHTIVFERTRGRRRVGCILVSQTVHTRYRHSDVYFFYFIILIR